MTILHLYLFCIIILSAIHFPAFLSSLPPSLSPSLPLNLPFTLLYPLPLSLSFFGTYPTPQILHISLSPSLAHNNIGKLITEEVEYLVEGKQSSDPGNMGPLFEWLPQQIWPRIKALEGLKRFSG